MMAGVEFRPSMEMGMTALKTFANPSVDIIKTLPEGPIELALRVIAMVLALTNLISAAVCQGAIDNSLLRGAGVVPDTPLFDTAAWVIFLSFWVMIYQLLAIIQLFVKADILYISIPFIDWSIFFLIDIIAIGIAAAGYVCGAVPLAVYAAQWADFNGQSELGSVLVVNSASSTSFLSFIGLFFFTGMIAYFFVAQIALKWSTHGELNEDTAEIEPPLDNYRPAPE